MKPHDEMSRKIERATCIARRHGGKPHIVRAGEVWIACRADWGQTARSIGVGSSPAGAVAKLRATDIRAREIIASILRCRGAQRT